MGNLFSMSLSLDRCVYGSWNCITTQANYVCKLEKNCRALEIAIKNLRDQKNDVKTKVRLAEEQGLAPLEQVKSWISKVEDAEVDINEVIEDGAQEIEKLCLGGCCSKSFKSSYMFGTKVAEKLEYVASLKSDGVFEVVAERVPLAPVNPMPSEPAVGMESTFDKVWSCLSQEQLGIIGIYGLGGVGKTTLLRQINNHFLSDSEFVIIWVVVSKDLNLQKIQDDIWKSVRSLDESWERKSQSDKAAEILKVLSKKKFVLLLDDIWEQVDLPEIGVPLPNNTNKSKVIFTTRSKDVCGLMDAHKKIEVECLSWEKAWELFQEKVGADTLSIHPDIPMLAESVAKECKGLPLALITVGRALASKDTPEQWEYAIDILRNSASKFSGMEDKVFAQLKFSFDNLKNDAYKSCFLYCALFPEDYVIDKSHLIDYWIGERFLGEYNNLNKARNEGHHIIGTLVNACLLEGENGGDVKMHDLMRDMALWIVSENGKKKNYFLVEAREGLIEAPAIEKWEGAKMISLMRNGIKQVRMSPSCLNLTTLLLNHNRIGKISDDVFDHMPNLLVLDLSNNAWLGQVPLGISKLISLQYLNLSETGISQLPIELTRLINLKYLNLENGARLNLIPKNFLSSFIKLQVCKMNGCSQYVSTDFFSRNECLIDELESLKYLQDLGIDIKNVSSLQRCCLSKKLQCCTRGLNLASGTVDLRSINVSSLKKFESLDWLTISGIGKFEIDWDEIRETRYISFLHNLHHVTISGCLRSVRDITWLFLAPNIRSLVLFLCEGMKEVLDIEKLGESPEMGTNLNPFSKLETLSLRNLPQLESIYPNALSFPCLKEIIVFHCRQLKRLPLNSDTAKGRKITIQGRKEWWDNLQWEDEAAQNTFLPCFKELA